MVMYFRIILFSIILQVILSQRFIEQWASYERSTGSYSAKILAEPENASNPIQYHVCKIAFRQSKLKVNLYNCNCGWRIDWYRYVIQYKCDYCENVFWTPTNAIRITFCHQNDWTLQKTQTFETGNTQSRNWREVNCPKNQYATGFSARFGYHYSADAGLVGGQLRCSNLNFNETTLVQDDLTIFPLTEMTSNRNKTLLQALQFKFVQKDKIYGIKGYFRQLAIVVNRSIEYGQIQLVGPEEIKIIEKIEKSNIGTSAINYDVLYTQNYTITNMWVTDAQVTTNSSGSVLGIQLIAPALNDTKPSDDIFIKTTAEIVQEIRVQSITYVPSGKSILTSIPSCKKLIALAQIIQQRATALYTLIFKWIEPATKQLVTKKYTGKWIGLVRNPIKTDRYFDDIPGCADS